MQYRTLGKTGFRVSLVSYGTGGPSKFGQNTGLTASEQDALVRRCLDLGINLFDTSEQYGDSDTALGRALQGVSRDAYFIATKWAHHVKQERLKDDAEDLVRSVEGSLKRLRTDHVDVMQFHGIIMKHYQEIVDRFYPVMQRLKEQGKIRAIGFSEMMTIEPKHDTVVYALNTHPELWETVMLKYGILNQWAAREALPLAQKHNVGILNMAPVRLTLTRPEQLGPVLDEWRRDGTIPQDALQGDDPFGWLAGDGVGSVISAGYKFAADHPGISTVITGTSSIEHLEQNVAAMEDLSLQPGHKEQLVELLGASASTH